MLIETYRNLDRGREIGLDDIPSYSNWPHRLLGLSEWNKQERSIEKVLQEYDREKYDRCLSFENISQEYVDQIRSLQLRVSDESLFAVTVGNNIYLNEYLSVKHLYKDIVRFAVEKAKVDDGTFVELGGGWGYNLSILLDDCRYQQWFVGDISPKALTLASKIFSERTNVTNVKFNFYDHQSYEIFKHLSYPVVVFTSEAIEQISSTEVFLAQLSLYRDKIAAVVHLEPMPSVFGKNLLGLMRQRYTDLNSYNCDLLGRIENNHDIEITSFEKEIFGFHPFNPLSVLVWKFGT